MGSATSACVPRTEGHPEAGPRRIAAGRQAVRCGVLRLSDTVR